MCTTRVPNNIDQSIFSFEEMEELLQDNADLVARRRDALANILPLVEWPERPGALANYQPSAERMERRGASSVLNLLILMMFIPEKFVRLVEETVGWTDLDFGIPEGDQVLEMSPGDRDFRPLRRVVQALRDIAGKTMTPGIRFLMQNLREYKTLLGSLLDEMKLCRELRFPLNSQPPLNLPTRHPNDLPVPNTDDPTAHAGALKVLLNELRVLDYRVVLLDPNLAKFDQHIFTVHRLIEFLR